jgi:hypothetical protein
VLAPTTPLTKVTRAIVATKRRDAVVTSLRALWPPLMVLAAVGALGFVTQNLPAALVSLLAGVALVAAAWLFYRAVQGFNPMGDEQAGYRLEADAGLKELAPLTAMGDRPMGGNTALWDWHQTQLSKSAATLTKPSNPRLTGQDGLRGLALLLAIGICVWHPAAAGRALTFDLSPLVGDGDLVLDAWAQPPEYTGLPVVRMSRESPNVSLPVGSIIHARMDGAKGAPRLNVPGSSKAMVQERGQAWSASAGLVKSGAVTLDRFGARARWNVTAIKDRPPSLSGTEAIKVDAKGRLDVAFTATDDYGIASVSLRVTPIHRPEGLVGTAVFETPIELESEADEEGARRVFVDVAQHVLTGLEVKVALVVRDGLGQETVSPETRLVMPTVKWKSALGQALQEQRLLILREGRPYQSRPPALATLFEPQTGLPISLDLSQPLEGAPPGIARGEQLLSTTLSALRQTGLSEVGLMGLQFARERLALARNVEDAHAVAPILWDLALQAETADQTPAQQKIAAARQGLEQALKNGASEEEIRSLSQELREAVGERLNELAQENGGSGSGGTQGEGGNEVSGGDIDGMLRELERSGSAGACQEALDQLDKLAELMENLQPGGQSGGDGEPQAGGQAGAGGALDDAMRAQRDLSDETNARQNQGEAAPDLAQRQRDLADQLARPSSPPSDDGDAGKAEAAKAMREAADALKRGDLSAAREAQSRAEQALQQAAQSANSGGEGNQDPLGRNLPKLDDGRGTKVPDQVEKRRARDVREELRRRQADPNRDGQEKDYLDRLLKDR